FVTLRSARNKRRWKFKK
ncbi:HAMP domain protein, partial [Vibrio parahaemolyticus VP2007-007]